MKILRINPDNPEKNLVLLASAAIEGGKILVYPTDTVYGIGCSIRSSNIQRIFELKKRGRGNPLSVAFSSLEMVKGYVFLTERDEGFIRDNLVKPYTFVARKKRLIPESITAGGDTVGIRIPDHKVVKAIIDYANIPIITTSANISGEPAPAGFDEIDEELIAGADIAIDSGRCRIGKPSTVIDLESGRVLR